MTYRIEADIRYLDGTLAGMDLPSGYAVTAPDLKHAYRYVGFVVKTRAAKDFVRAAVTGNRYQFISEPRLVRL
jgi:hypothetical protein